MSVIVGFCWCNLTVCMSELHVMLRRALAQLYSGPGWFWRHSVAAGRSHTQQCFYCVHKVANISVIREDTHTLTHTQTCFFLGHCPVQRGVLYCWDGCCHGYMNSESGPSTDHIHCC